MKRIFALALSALVLALSDPAQAQQQQKIPRVGYLAGFGDPTNPGQPVEAVRQGLRKLGYIEGKNIHVDYRYVEEKQERVPRLVEELFSLRSTCWSFRIPERFTRPNRPVRRSLLS